MSKETRWTPGPWFVHTLAERSGPEEQFFWAVSREPDEDQPCDYIACSDGDVGIDVDRAISNAHLIAAAPEIYEQLEETHAALCFRDPEYLGSERHARNAAALAKARGETP